MTRLISFEYCYDTDGTDLSVGTFMINGGTTSIYLRYDECKWPSNLWSFNDKLLRFSSHLPFAATNFAPCLIEIHEIFSVNFL